MIYDADIAQADLVWRPALAARRGSAESPGLVSGVVHRVNSGDNACVAHSGLTICIQLGAQPVAIRLDCEGEKFEGRFLPGDLTTVPSGATHAYAHRNCTSVGHLSIEPEFIKRICEGTPPARIFDCRLRFQDPLIEHVMRATALGGSRLFMESAAVVILERLAQVGNFGTHLAAAPRIRQAMEYIRAVR